MSSFIFRWVYIVAVTLALSLILIFLNSDFDFNVLLLSFVCFPILTVVNRKIITFCEAYWYLDPPIRGPWTELLSWYIDNSFFCGLIATAFSAISVYVIQDMKDVCLINFLYGLYLCFAFSFIVALVDVLFGFDEAEINENLKDDESIGAFWAIGAFKAYYEVLFDDIVKRMTAFEKEHKIQFCTKKFIVILPLSCNVRKTLDRDWESNIEVFGELECLEHDQGANINRKYKSTVYKITEGFDEFYIVGAFASSLNTLWMLRDTIEAEVKMRRQIGRMNNLEWKYHRDCFIEKLEHLVKDYPCIFLKYNDKNTEQSLSAFLKYELLKRGFLKK